MRNTLVSCAIFASLLSCTSKPVEEQVAREPQSTRQELQVQMVRYEPGGVDLRVGVFPESTAMKACVLYLQGLGDSIRNHDPLFRVLSENGYRVITYDYLGQGGSGGSMNSTRLSGDSYKAIGTQARWLWSNHPECASSKKFVIGWSTGGLATYKLAFEKWADAVVLIAPGIHPKILVGETAENITKAFASISERTLTRNTYAGVQNPHLDPPWPNSPVRPVAFSANLLLTSKRSHWWKIPSTVRGAVLLSGVEDTYVYREKTMKTLSKNAPHFQVTSYDGALHELDNELPDVANDVRRRIIQLFDTSLH